MARTNTALQAIGIAIIVITFIVIGVSFGAPTFLANKRITISDMFPKAEENPKNDAVLTSIASLTDNEASVQSPLGSVRTVRIVLGAGEPKTVPLPFSPGSLVVHTGDTVKWINQDNVAHTVTSTYFNSGMISPNAASSNSSSTFTHKFDKSGTYSYFCQIHPYMSGTIYVDVQETQRQLVSTNHPGQNNLAIEMPRNAAYQNNFGPYFIPANAIIPSGSRVTWVNHDFIAHTATAGDAISFDTEAVLPTESKTLIVNGTGRIAYYCEIHPWMQASLTIVSP
jgi:plastocyanin